MRDKDQIEKHHKKHHKKHKKHHKEQTVSIGRGGLYAPGYNWWGSMYCGVGLCSGVSGNHDTDGENNDTVGVGGEGGESASAGIGAAAGAGLSASGL